MRQDEAAAPQLPPDALRGMGDWAATIAWMLAPERVTWRLAAPGGQLRYLKVYRVGQELSLAAERDRTAWVAPYLPVPRILAYGTDDTHEWLLTAGLDGTNAVDDRWRADPARLVPILADALRRFHTLPVDRCPFDSRADRALRAARRRVERGLVDAARDLHPNHGPITAEEALARAEQLRPRQEDLVVCHLDPCLPNVLLSEWRVTGYVDLGKLGVADRWWDLAITMWSITHNLGPGWEDAFLDAYGVQRDLDKLAFYRLLYDLVERVSIVPGGM